MGAARARAQAGNGKGGLMPCSQRAAVVGMPRCQCCAGSMWEKEPVDPLPRELWCAAGMGIWAAQASGRSWECEGAQLC